MFIQRSLSLLSLVSAVLTVSTAAEPQVSASTVSTFKAQECRTFPGDAKWPSDADWKAFNKTVGGRLIRTVPLASVCHDTPLYDEAKCQELQKSWFDPEIHVESSHSIMAPFFANQSCDPFTDKGAPCSIGTYVQYAVDATGADDYKKTIAFAEKHNIRLVIRNTGHDYHGKSTGAGSLALWTHHMTDIEVIKNYRSQLHNGPAIKVGAGVLVRDANKAAHDAGLVIVSGNCATVGVAGGYTQGGGHGPLTSAYGLSADNVLEWEVVTADGKIVKATPSKNQDLYWALSGGGGGTFGAVLSVTVRAHEDKKVAAATLDFGMDGVSPDNFYQGIGALLGGLPRMTDKDVFVIFLLTPIGVSVSPATAPGLCKEELDALFKPVLDKLAALGIKYAYKSKEYPSYLDSYNDLNGGIAVNNAQMGGRIMPRSLLEPKNLPKLVKTISEVLNAGTIISGLGVNANKKPIAPNSVHPAWREAGFVAVVGTLWDNTNMDLNLKNQDLITNQVVPKLAALTPYGAAYLNEADFQQPNFQQVFYGRNYPKLRMIKKKYDPKDIFYGKTGVGSEDWTTETPDGRLCRTRTGIFEACTITTLFSRQCAAEWAVLLRELYGDIKDGW